MTTSSKLLRTLALTACLGLSVTACGSNGAQPAQNEPSSSSTSTPSESETGAPERAGADLVIWADDLRAKALKGVAEEFGEANGITVAVQAVSEDLQTNFVTANTAGNGPDVVVGAHDWIGNMVQNSAIDPLNLPEAQQAEFSDIALKGVTFDSKTYGVPYAVESIALFRNTDLVPDAPATVEDLVASGKASGAENPLCLQQGQEGDAYHMYPLYSSAGGYLFGQTPEGDYDPTDLGVGGPGSIAAAEKEAWLAKEGALKTSITGDNSISLFAEGKCAYLVSGPWATADVKKAGINYALSPIPGFAGMEPAQPLTGVQAFYVASKGKNKAFAEQFLLDAAATPETMDALYEAEPRPSALKDALAKQTAADADTAVFAQAAEGGQILPAIPAMAGVWEPLGKAHAAIINGADPAQTMTSAGDAIRAAIG
ncbi:arabinogalactan oligomer/maltooligosaccharide transport system substrate-binding protein [Kineococcus xinjiangensis]|uniref:Arabinogalactan oligomer/maltooligosaccharide transport system substrate-binding protein n=1 Tax=Kineococcus xinjiangensis TaxID=512762 RepID=A0A2S6IDZ9_9ACTN|nr:maltose ABC transporter substrate-binding protein [Kineococcus xinjiangensis]PPK92431.1 arabinogalactan oligomer/maltooligosaccharide transport system substrate-binding protein [Kineococcus xinjiangensis]